MKKFAQRKQIGQQIQKGKPRKPTESVEVLDRTAGEFDVNKNYMLTPIKDLNTPGGQTTNSRGNSRDQLSKQRPFEIQTSRNMPQSGNQPLISARHGNKSQLSETSKGVTSFISLQQGGIGIKKVQKLLEQV